MFPEFSPAMQETTTTGETSLGKSFLYDFEAKDFIVKDGKLTLAVGIDGLKVWIEKILKTEKFKFQVYENGSDNQYGATLLGLVNSGLPQIFVQAEIQREITEAMLRNPLITAVSNFSFTRNRRSLVIGFEVSTVYGTIAQEVSI